MAWVTLTNNQWVSRADLQNAVSTGVFTLKAGQTIPAGNNWVTRSQVETWVNATVSSGTSVQWPQKSWITPINSYLSLPFMPTEDWPSGVCSYNFSQTVYRAGTNSGNFYTDTGLTTLAHTGLVLHTADKEVYQLAPSGGFTAGIYMLDHTAWIQSTITTTSGANTAGGRRIYNNPSGAYKITATVASTNNPSVVWYIRMTNVDTGAVVATSSSTTTVVGNTLTLNFNTAVCQTFVIFMWSESTTESSNTFSVTFTPQ